MKLCLFITGTTGSGKSTLVEKLGMMGWVTVHTGDMFRKFNAEKSVSAGESVIAPASFDSHVYNAIRSALQQASASLPALVAVECCPRSEKQIDWIREAVADGWVVQIVCLDADVGVRENRVVSRSCATLDPKRLQRDVDKLREEGSTFTESLFNSFEPDLVSPVLLDTSNWQYTNNQVVSLGSMIQIALNFYRRKQSGLHWAQQSSSAMVRRCQEELSEHHQASGKAHRLEELIDALWFLLLACNAEGASAEDICRMFVEKASVNNLRESRQIKPHVTSAVRGEGETPCQSMS